MMMIEGRAMVVLLEVCNSDFMVPSRGAIRALSRTTTKTTFRGICDYDDSQIDISSYEHSNPGGRKYHCSNGPIRRKQSQIVPSCTVSSVDVGMAFTDTLVDGKANGCVIEVYILLEANSNECQNARN